MSENPEILRLIGRPCVVVGLMSLTMLGYGAAFAQNNPDAMAEGKAFASSMLPTARNQVTSAGANSAAKLPANAPEQSPLYTTEQPGAAHFSSGLGLITQGSAAITNCNNYVPTGNAIKDQECAGVNFLANNPTRIQFNIDKSDPALANFANAAASAVNSESPGQQCVARTVTTPGTFTTDRCSQTSVFDTVTCNKVYTPACSVGEAILAGMSASGTGALQAAIQPDGRPGMYTLTISGSGTGTTGNARINFDIPKEVSNAVLKITMAPIDDAGAVAVNDVPVWAGFPNAGPQLTNFPPMPSFVANYSWSEMIGGKNYVFTADTKLQDSCPAGYSPIRMSTMRGTNTASYLAGFFCNGRGEFLMNRHEGRNVANSTLNTSVSLKTGANSIKAFWGTTSSGFGSIRVTATIALEAVNCTATVPWVDECTKARGAL